MNANKSNKSGKLTTFKEAEEIQNQYFSNRLNI